MTAEIRPGLFQTVSLEFVSLNIAARQFRSYNYNTVLSAELLLQTG